MTVQPYLYFNGRCEEALEFYKQHLGAEVTFLMRFKQNPDPNMQPPPGLEEKVMHTQFKIGDTELMASDGNCNETEKFQGFTLTLNCPTSAEAERLFNLIASHGGQVQMPLMQTFFSPKFGMVADKFGLSWMVLAAPHS